VSFANIRIETQLLTGHWWGKGEPIYIAVGEPQAGPGSGEISNVTFSNISGDAESSIVLYGHPDAWLHNIVFDDVHFTLRTTRKDVNELVGGNFDFRWTAPSLKEAVFKHDIPGIYGRYVDGLHVHNSSIAWCITGACDEKLLTAKDAKNRGEGRGEKLTGTAKGFFSSAIELEDFKDLDADGFRGTEAPGSSAAAISLSNGSGVLIRNSTAGTGTQVFLEAHKVSGRRLLLSNDLANAGTVLKGDVAGFVLRGNYAVTVKPQASRSMP
jgi:hypothetical protein